MLGAGHGGRFRFDSEQRSQDANHDQGRHHNIGGAISRLLIESIFDEGADPEQGASPMPAPQPEAPEPTVQTVELSEDIVKIAEVRAHHFRMSERTFAQYLFDHDIYRHRTKDGREVPIPHTTLRQWLQRAREAGVL